MTEPPDPGPEPEPSPEAASEPLESPEAQAARKMTFTEAANALARLTKEMREAPPGDADLTALLHDPQTIMAAAVTELTSESAIACEKSPTG